MDARILLVKDAAHELGVSEQSIRLWTDSGELVCIKTPGGVRLITTRNLERFRRRREREKNNRSDGWTRKD